MYVGRKKERERRERRKERERERCDSSMCLFVCGKLMAVPGQGVLRQSMALLSGRSGAVLDKVKAQRFSRELHQ